MIGSASFKLLRSLRLARATVKPEKLRLKRPVHQEKAGFTLVELLVVVIIVGVIAVIAAPNWLGFVNQRRVNAANDTVLRAIQDAQSQAKNKKVNYSVSFRTETGKTPEIAVYPTKQLNNTGTLDDVDPRDSSFTYWKSLGQDLGLKPRQVSLWTNIGTGNQANQAIRSDPGSGADIGTIIFDEMGAVSQNPTPIFGGTATNPKGLIVMVAVPSGTNPVPLTQRCVIVKTLLGSLQIQKGAQCNF
ncbi:MAG TPA: prepilin-type cleavage/methylation domain-containing protein [Cyanobacteria bacterium UBA8553]|nr:prepilin-type cleavage/methylation domain-containing protein [Cyanobacteria bacterium UBA8553]HAJ59620.1 prepilin-type cleavage/methylation domain-containing protein [Cyanobacteria bacterium UBA8543]